MRRGWRTKRLENSVRERRTRNRETARDQKKNQRTQKRDATEAEDEIEKKTKRGISP